MAKHLSARPAGFEPATTGFEGRGDAAATSEKAADPPVVAPSTDEDRSARGNPGGNPDPVEGALARALDAATAAGEWSIVAQLARELEARRQRDVQAKVIPLDKARRAREK